MARITGSAGEAYAINTVAGSGRRPQQSSVTGPGLAGDAYAINKSQPHSKSNNSAISYAGLINPRSARLAIANLAGGINNIAKKIPNVIVQQDAGANNAPIPLEDDWRVRISLGDKSDIFYKSSDPGIMAPLKETNGVIYPYTPKIVVTHLANYSPTALTHSNYHQQFFTDSQVSDIVISSDFTVQNVDEGKYIMAVVYFFRAATKMFFGNGDHTGNPPPLVFLNGYGDQYFPNIPCVITNVSHDMPDDVDYISIPTTNGETATRDIQQRQVPQTKFVRNSSTGQRQAVPAVNQTASPTTSVQSAIVNNTRVPAVSRLSVTLRPMYSRANLADNFSLEDFAAGKLLGKNGMGGFI